MIISYSSRSSRPLRSSLTNLHRLRPPVKPLLSVLLLPLCSNHHQHRTLLTLAIETSCNDTSVAILSRTANSTKLLFNERISSDNREFKGIHPLVAVRGHSAALAPLVQRALEALPNAEAGVDVDTNAGAGAGAGADALESKVESGGNGAKRVGVCFAPDGSRKQVPDFVSVTRGPGMRSNLGIGLDTAKGLAIAWGVPIVGVHHMQAHALTPRLARALGMSMGEASTSSSSSSSSTSSTPSPTQPPPKSGPEFPFLSLLVSGGHTQLVHSTSLTTHSIIATTGDIAIGNLLDQTARDILPKDVFEASDTVMYGRLLESFAFPQGDTTTTPAEYDAVFTPSATRGDEMNAVPSGYDWDVPLPFRQSRKLAFSFSSIYTHVNDIATSRPDMSIPEQRALAQHTMMAAFKHIAGRLCIALQDLPHLQDSKTLVVAGGVACNRFLMHILRRTLQARGFSVADSNGETLEIVASPVELCTDNAAMIAWAGMEMFEAGYHSDLSMLSIGKWPMDPGMGDGILGVGGWLKRESCEGERANDIDIVV